jgi:hypothetical protein
MSEVVAAEAASVIEGVVLNGGEQEFNGKVTGFLFGQDADPDYISLLKLHPDTVIRIPFDQVSVEAGFNARNFANKSIQEHVEETANSIAVRGVETPISVRIEGNRIIVVDGEVRTRATYLANDKGHDVPTIPALLSPDGDDPVARVEDLITKNSGRPLTMPEQVVVVNRLLGLGLNKPQVLDRLGFSRTMFARLMILAEAPADVFDHAAKGDISPTAVVQLMTQHREAPAEEISKIVNKAVKKAQKDAEAALSEGKTALKGAATQAKASDIAAVLEEEDVKTPVYSKTTFVGALKLLQHIYNSLDKRLADNARAELRQGIVNYAEGINVDINEPLPETKAPLTEEEKAARAAKKAEEDKAKEAEKAKIAEARAIAKQIKDEAEAKAKAALAAAGYVAPVRKPKAAKEADAPADAPAAE